MKKQTAGRDNLGKLAPEFAHLNDDILFGEVWSREDKLSLKERSEITIAALAAQGLFLQVKAHLQLGKENGITKEEAVEIATHLAFYCSWATTWNLMGLIKEVYGDKDNSAKSQTHGGTFGLGKPNDAFAKYFIGKSYLNVLTKPDDYLTICNVTFEPGCRNNWHIHHATKGGGQVLIAVDGEGWYQEEGKAPVKMTPGTIVEIPANVKHWHGATAGSWFSHLAFEYPGENTSNEWLEPVTDEEYNKLSK